MMKTYTSPQRPPQLPGVLRDRRPRLGRIPWHSRAIDRVIASDSVTRWLIEGHLLGVDLRAGDQILFKRLSARGCTPEEAIGAVLRRRSALGIRTDYIIDEILDLVMDAAT